MWGSTVLSSEAAVHGNYPEAKPDGEALKGRRSCRESPLSNALRPMLS